MPYIHDDSGALVQLSHLGPGEDPLNGVVVTEGVGEWATILASQTDQILGSTGASGDFLERLIVTVNTAATATVSIKDGTGASIPVCPANPGAGIGTYPVPLGIKSVDGGWKLSTGAGCTVIAVGRFT